MKNGSYDALQRLWALKQSGALSEAEFSELKAKVLGKNREMPQAEPARSDSPDRSLAEDSHRTATSKKAGGCLLALVGALAFLIVITALAPDSDRDSDATSTSKQGTAGGPSSGSDDDPALVSRSEFKARGLKWPLTAEEGRLGCTRLARWIEVDEVRYGLNGSASEREGYMDLSAIWAVDEKMAADLRKAGLPNEPPLRVNVGDMIEEAGKFC